ncbi:MAG: hypothetical protein R6X17_14285, partial [Candidatus Competibacteraceae bacterium]
THATVVTLAGALAIPLSLRHLDHCSFLTTLHFSDDQATRLVSTILDVPGLTLVRSTTDGWRYQTLHFSNLTSEMPPPAEETAEDAPTPADAPKTE